MTEGLVERVCDARWLVVEPVCHGRVSVGRSHTEIMRVSTVLHWEFARWEIADRLPGTPGPNLPTFHKNIEVSCNQDAAPPWTDLRWEIDRWEIATEILENSSCVVFGDRSLGGRRIEADWILNVWTFYAWRSHIGRLQTEFLKLSNSLHWEIVAWGIPRYKIKAVLLQISKKLCCANTVEEREGFSG